MVNRFSVTPLGGLDVGTKLTNVIEGGRKQQRFKKMQEEAPTALASGNPTEIASFMLKYPEMAETMNKATGVQEEGQKQELVSVAKGLLTPGVDPKEVLADYAMKLKGSNRDPKMAVSMLSKVMADPKTAQQMGEKLFAMHSPDEFVNYQKAQGGSGTTNKQKTGAFLVKGADGTVSIAVGSFDPATGKLRTEKAEIPGGQLVSKLGETGNEESNRKVVENAKKTAAQLGVELQLKPQVEGEVAGAKLDQQIEKKPQIAALETRAKQEEARNSDLIERGLLAAESTAITRRGIDLLKSIKTGGFANAKYQAKRILGIESADEGELASNLGKAVLSQLRETFGAQFTDEEGKRLGRIEASLGKSAAANTRLLNQALAVSNKVAKRARRKAVEIGDEETVKDIDDLLIFELTDEPLEETQTTTELTDEELEKIAFGK